jgi:alkylation response protein AidB-like acyl-CoA dehydrogenase
MSEQGENKGSDGTKEAIGKARAVAEDSGRKFAGRNDAEARFPQEGVDALGTAGLLGLALPRELGGLGLGPRAFAGAAAALAETDASLSMIFVMHTCGSLVAAGSSGSPSVRAALQAMAQGKHLTTLAFSEKGSRSHFWAPVSQAKRNGSGVHLTAEKSFVTSAGHAQSYVATAQAPEAKAPMESTLYLVDAKSPGIKMQAAWNGMGLRGNASSPLSFSQVPVDDSSRLTPDGKGFDTMLSTVLPWFNLGISAMSLGICRGAVGATITHLKASRIEHLNQSLAEAFPVLRARLAQMMIETSALEGMVDRLVGLLESPSDATVPAVLATKAAANEIAVRVTSEAMRACGGAAFSKQTSIDRYFRDAQAGQVMAPTVDQLQDFLGKALVGLPLF